MNIPLPRLQDIVGWLHHQLKTWLAIIVDTRQCAREIAQHPRAGIHDVIIKLISLALFVFFLDALLFLPINVAIWNLDVSSPIGLLSELALFCVQIVISTVCVHILSIVVTRNHDLRVAFAFVLLMLAFYPILHLAEAPLRVILPRDVMEALYVGNVWYVLDLDGLQQAKMLLVGLLLSVVFMWYIRRSTMALVEIYLIGPVRALFVVVTALVSEAVVKAFFVGPLFLRVVGSQGVVG